MKRIVSDYKEGFFLRTKMGRQYIIALKFINRWECIFCCDRFDVEEQLVEHYRVHHHRVERIQPTMNRKSGGYNGTR